jgi:hypothetical protein
LHAQNQILTQMLPIGSQVHQHAIRLKTSFTPLLTLLTPQDTLPLEEQVYAWRQSVAPLCPPEFTLHLDYASEDKDLPFDPRILYALKLLFLHFLQKEEEEWVTIEFQSHLKGESSTFTLKLDPPFHEYASTPITHLAAALLPLND